MRKWRNLRNPEFQAPYAFNGIKVQLSLGDYGCHVACIDIERGVYSRQTEREVTYKKDDAKMGKLIVNRT